MRKILMALTGPSLLVVAALSAIGTAHAAPGDAQWNSIKGTAKPDGTLATEDHKNPRHKTNSSDGRVILDLKNTVDGSLCVILYDFKNEKLLSGDRPVCWEKRQSGQKTLVNNMPAGSEFNVIAMKDGGSDNDWGGSIYY
jgi:hypothetical protein